MEDATDRLGYEGSPHSMQEFTVTDDTSDLSPQEQLLFHALGPGQVPLATIEEMLQRRVEEDLHLDYKRAAVLTADQKTATIGHPKHFGGKLRKYVCGYANADGGVVVIGVGERPKKHDPDQKKYIVDPASRRHFDPIPMREGEDYEAASRRILELAGQALLKLSLSLTRPPKLQTVEHPDGVVLVVAVPRSDQRVYCIEKEQMVPYLRLHDSTTHAPAYLIEDLVLGRRRTPTIRMLPGRVHARVEHHAGPNDPRLPLFLNLSFQINNTSLVAAEGLSAGLLIWSNRNTELWPSPEVLQQVDCRIRPYQVSYFPLSIDKGGLVVDVPPLHTATADVVHPLSSLMPFTDFDGVQTDWWAGALFVAAKNLVPQWWQVLILVTSMHDRVVGTPLLAVAPSGDRRPVIDFHEAKSDRDVPFQDWCEVERPSRTVLRLTVRPQEQ